MAAFAAAALLLAVTGIHAVVMYGVSQRAREISIRIALGARGSNIARLVIGEGARYIVIGLDRRGHGHRPHAARVHDAVRTLNASDPMTFVQVSAVVAVTSLLACAVPTIRAVRTDPAGGKLVASVT